MSSLLCDVFHSVNKRVARERVRERLEMDETKRYAEHHTRHTHIEFEAKINTYFSTIKQRKLNLSIYIFGGGTQGGRSNVRSVQCHPGHPSDSATGYRTYLS